MNAIVSVLDGLVYIAGWAALAPVLIFIGVIVLCNAWEAGKALWRSLVRRADATLDWWS